MSFHHNYSKMKSMETHLLTISHAIQLAVAPVFLLTGVAHILNVLITRLGRVIDRSRVIQSRMQEWADADNTEPLTQQDPNSNQARKHQRQQEEDLIEMDALKHRLRLVYLAIFFAVLAALLICIVVATGFIGALTQIDTSKWLAGLFIASMIAMIICLSLLIREVFVAVVPGKMHHRP
jgi:polyferredoxin